MTIEKLNAPYEFDPNLYKLSDSSDSSDEDDDILIDILSDKLNLRKVQDMIKKKSRGSKSKKSTGLSHSSKKSKSPKRASKAVSNFSEDDSNDSAADESPKSSKRKSKRKSRKPSKKGNDSD